MKTPRLTDFDPDAKAPSLKSPMDGMPAIQKPSAGKKELKHEPAKEPNHDLPGAPDRSEGVNSPAGKDDSQFASKLVNQQTSKPENQQASLLANQQTSKTALSTKQKKKYGTYLREDTILQIRIHAASAKKKDHELLQEILDAYFKRLKQ